MLTINNKKKIEQYIDKIIENLKEETKKDLNNHIPNKVILNKLVKTTCEKLMPESKSILSSVYYMMMDETLAKKNYKDPKMKAAFYEMNLLQELNNKFIYEVPTCIAYNEKKLKVNKLIEASTVSVLGGIISVQLKSWIPVGIAGIIAIVISFLFMKDNSINFSRKAYKQSQAMSTTIDKYLENVKSSLVSWINSIEIYYDKRVQDLERER